MEIYKRQKRKIQKEILEHRQDITKLHIHR